MRSLTTSGNREECGAAILLALKSAGKPSTSDAIYAVVQSFFADRRTFARTLGGLTRARSVFVRDTGKKGRIYSLDPADGDDYGVRQCMVKVSPVVPPDTPPRIDQIYTRQAVAMIAAIQSAKVAPIIRNNPDKKRT